MQYIHVVYGCNVMCELSRIRRRDYARAALPPALARLFKLWLFSADVLITREMVHGDLRARARPFNILIFFRNRNLARHGYRAFHISRAAKWLGNIYCFIVPVGPTYYTLLL